MSRERERVQRKAEVGNEVKRENRQEILYDDYLSFILTHLAQ